MTLENIPKGYSVPVDNGCWYFMKATRSSLICVALCSFGLFTSAAFAEDSYSWTDKNGRVFYGSTPPANASSVTKLRTKGLSRYSSDRMLKRLGWGESKSEPKTLSKSGSSSTAKKMDHVPAPASLSQGDIQLELDNNKQVLNCRVPIKNSGSKEAKEISVAFEFADGTLVPGVGPDVIAPGSTADYSIPKELAPITLHAKSNGENPAQDVPPPRVIIHGVED